jgi:hypothetical protein
MGAIDIKYPNISATSERGQLEQIRGYLYQLADQLKWAFNSMENASQTNPSKNGTTSEKDGITSLNSIKALLMKSALKDIEKKIVSINAIDTYESKDLNELVSKTGYYVGKTNPSSVSCANYPVDETGVLEVISVMESNLTGFAYQTYRTHTGKIYTRSYNSENGWTSWKEIA